MKFDMALLSVVIEVLVPRPTHFRQCKTLLVEM